ncbi:MAG: lipopolysaccharide heptosyltransferase II [Candidatus Omnitrophota bacterium]|nr:MAG: lipopolysaccharide heptosyltransferase II [Candidatus Omnitrophota bacterium]
MERILVVSVNWLGDALLATPVFKALKEKMPFPYVAVMAPERIREVFSENPYIDEVIICDEKMHQKSLFDKLRFARMLKRKRFDTAFLVHRSFTRALICRWAGISKRIGYKRLKNAFVLTNTISVKTNTLHRQDYYLSLFERSGIPIRDRAPQFFISGVERERMNIVLEGIKQRYSFIVGVHPSANWELKRWPDESFSRLCDRLIEELGCGIVFIGTQKDKSIVEKVMENMKKEAFNFCGKTNLKELGVLLESMNLFVSNDSGPAHLSMSMGTDTLVLFGPTSAHITGPRGKSVKILQKDVGCKIPCYKLNCRDNKCMKYLRVDEVFEEAKRILLNLPR